MSIESYLPGEQLSCPVFAISNLVGCYDILNSKKMNVFQSGIMKCTQNCFQDKYKKSGHEVDGAKSPLWKETVLECL